ncbi:MAG: GNAT family N-acetyltransferase [Owenweeksia sp.]|nr:GNAT family N-acetyltransferase [Owenweeksia sp.]
MSPEKRVFSLKRPEKEQAVLDPVNPELIHSEIDKLRNSGAFLFKQRNYELMLAPSEEIPNLLTEIGRLREITFRAVGEGTNLPLDLDTFDYHYQHLILWDSDELKLAAAYRLGLGPGIYQKFGIKGFYVPTLFKVDEAMHKIFAQSLEMGRAFIVKEQQNKPLPLFLLWRGIFEVVQKKS